MTDLCSYKNMFGVPGQGVHSYRIFNIAVVDVLATLVLAFIISFIFNVSFFYTSIILFALGILLHRLFCVRTTIDKLLFPKVS